jgi:hypothetical protein
MNTKAGMTVILLSNRSEEAPAVDPTLDRQRRIVLATINGAYKTPGVKKPASVPPPIPNPTVTHMSQRIQKIGFSAHRTASMVKNLLSVEE